MAEPNDNDLLKLGGEPFRQHNQTRSRVIDPEPFGVLVGVVGIVGSVASTIAAFKTFAKESPTKTRLAALTLIDQTRDELRHLAADLEIVEEILSSAEITANRLFRPDTAAFLEESQFWRYDQAADRILARLRTLLRLTNKLDHLLPRLSDVRVGEAAKYIGDARGHLQRLLRDPNLPVEQALQDLVSVVQQVGSLIAELRSDLGG